MTQDEATQFLADALIHMLAETEEAIEAIKLEVAEVRRRLPGHDAARGD